MSDDLVPCPLPAKYPHCKGHPRGKCNAHSKRRAHAPCLAAPIQGKDKCKYHGGATPLKKDGRNSKYIRGHLAELIAQHAADPNLMDLKSHVAVLSALQTRMLGNISELDEKARLPDEDVEALRKVTDAITRAIERYEKTQQQPESLVPLEFVGRIVDAFGAVVNRYVSDDAAKRAILSALDSSLHLPTPPALH